MSEFEKLVIQLSSVNKTTFRTIHKWSK